MVIILKITEEIAEAVLRPLQFRLLKNPATVVIPTKEESLSLINEISHSIRIGIF